MMVRPLIKPINSCTSVYFGDHNVSGKQILVEGLLSPKMESTSFTLHLPVLVWLQQALMVEASIGFPPRISRFDAAIDFKFQQVIKIFCNCIMHSY